MYLYFSNLRLHLFCKTHICIMYYISKFDSVNSHYKDKIRRKKDLLGWGLNPQKWLLWSRALYLKKNLLYWTYFSLDVWWSVYSICFEFVFVISWKHVLNSLKNMTSSRLKECAKNLRYASERGEIAWMSRNCL